MKHQHFTRLKSLASVAAVGVTLGVMNSAQAATYQFQGILEESIFLTGVPEIGIQPNPEFYKGTFTFDHELLTGVGFESLGAEANLKVSLAEDPRVDQTLDIRFPEFPTVNFQDGALLGLDWFAVYHPFTAVPELDYLGDFVRISGTELTDGFDPTFYTPQDEPRAPILGFGSVAYEKVPEPASVIGVAIAALSAGTLLKKQSKPEVMASSEA